MISHFLPFLVPPIQEPRADRMRSPELDQQAVEVLPFLTNRCACEGGSVRVDGDLLEAFGLDGLERHDDPLEA